jgi:hypothetical protein
MARKGEYYQHLPLVRQSNPLCVLWAEAITGRRANAPPTPRRPEPVLIKTPRRSRRGISLSRSTGYHQSQPTPRRTGSDMDPATLQSWILVWFQLRITPFVGGSAIRQPAFSIPNMTLVRFAGTERLERL